MKKIFLIIFLLVGAFSFSQTNSISIDKEAIPAVEQFISDAKNKGFYLRFYLIEKIDEIVFTNTLDRKRLVGEVSENSRTIYLAESLRGNPLKIKIVVYHEIGHIIKNSGYHSCYNCNEIMTESLPEDLSHFKNKDTWNSILDTYFKWLSNKQ